MTDNGKKFGPDPNRAMEMPFEERHLVAEECVNKLGGRIRHCFRSAFAHLRRSWTLHPIDSEMSMFRAITAEEEAATALILALKQRKYEGADKLNPRDHVHKAAISPFLDSVVNLLVETGVPTPKLMISKGDRPKITILMMFPRLQTSRSLCLPNRIIPLISLSGKTVLQRLIRLKSKFRL